MRDAWDLCDADDDMVADFLAASVEAFVEAGGWIHPETRFVARAGHLHIECDGEDGEPLLRSPRETFLRVQNISWDRSADVLALQQLPADGGDIPLLLAQLGLFNSCNKLATISDEHPARADLDAWVIEATRALRPSFRTTTASPLDVFWSNRCFRLPAFDTQPEAVALPILDMLDHHADGASGTWDGSNFTVAIRHATDDARCYLNYGLQRDAIGMVTTYGFVDASTPWAHSAPLTININGTGTVEVSARGRRSDGVLVAPICQERDERVLISHLAFGGSDPVVDLHQATGRSTDWCAEVVAGVAMANDALLEAIERAVAAAQPSVAHRALGDAAATQRSALQHTGSAVLPIDSVPVLSEDDLGSLSGSH